MSGSSGIRISLHAAPFSLQAHNLQFNQVAVSGDPAGITDIAQTTATGVAIRLRNTCSTPSWCVFFDNTRYTPFVLVEGISARSSGEMAAPLRIQMTL